MSKFKLSREWSGYSRGTDYIIVEADTLEGAIEKAEDLESYKRDVVRDDTNTEEWSAK